jgi:hypothetical protein
MTAIGSVPGRWIFRSDRWSSGRLRVAVPAAVLTLAVVVTAWGATFEERLQSFESELARCNAEHGYDPNQAATLGPYELGAGEQAWRECAYTAIEQQLMAESPLPEIYRTLIDEDRSMTAAISRQELSRTERRVRLERLRRNAVLNEELNRSVTEAGPETQMQEQMRRLNEYQQYERLVAPRIAGSLGR